MIKKINTAVFLVLVLIFLCIVFWGGFSFYESRKKIAENKNISETTVKDSNVAIKEELPIISLKPSFYDEDILEKAIISSNNIKKRSDVRAIISPHHFLAANLISSVVGEASGRSIENVFIVGPNHNSIGKDIFATTKASWQTPFGYLETNSNLVKNFASDFDLVYNPQAFEEEHAIGSIAIFVKKYLPKSKLVPILIRSSAKEIDAHNLSDWLSNNVNKNDLVIFSMDFSHYLSENKANESDEYTKMIISNRDIGKISQLNDDYVDSPISLATSILFAQNEKLDTEFIENENSFNLSWSKSDSTTSYFTIRFTE